MGRQSTKKDKSIYQITRESLGYTRAEAEDVLDTLNDDRIEKIESGRILPAPSDILEMAKGYNAPHLCNYYCANQCPIGQEYVPEIQIKDLSQIVLEMLSSINCMNRKKEALIDITVDGKIDRNEISAFVEICKELEKISVAVESLQLWSEKMLASGVIDKEEFDRHIKSAEKN